MWQASEATVRVQIHGPHGVSIVGMEVSGYVGVSEGLADGFRNASRPLVTSRPLPLTTPVAK